MGVYILADQISDESDEVRYLVRDGVDESTQEVLIILNADPSMSRTEGANYLLPMSKAMIGKIIVQFRRSGKWPEKTGIQA